MYDYIVAQKLDNQYIIIEKQYISLLIISQKSKCSKRTLAFNLVRMFIRTNFKAHRISLPAQTSKYFDHLDNEREAMTEPVNIPLGTKNFGLIRVKNDFESIQAGVYLDVFQRRTWIIRLVHLDL